MVSYELQLSEQRGMDILLLTYRASDSGIGETKRRKKHNCGDREKFHLVAFYLVVQLVTLCEY